MADYGAAAINAGAGIFSSMINNIYGAMRESDARHENFVYGEEAADNADARTRKLYADLYGPEAQLQQIKNAGLSPSLFYGNAGGISGQSGAQGTGAAGISPTVFGMPAIDVAQIRLANAQANKADAEADNLKVDKDIKEIQKEIANLDKTKYQVEFDLVTGYVDKNGKEISLYELAEDYFNYDEFVKAVRDMYTSAGQPIMASTINSEIGQKTLRGIFMAKNEFHRNIKVLTAEGINAEFQKQIVDAMKNSEFAELNAKAAIQYLNTNISTSELNERQKKAWNNLIEKMDGKNTTMTDIIIVLASIVNTAASNWHMPSIAK